MRIVADAGIDLSTYCFHLGITLALLPHQLAAQATILHSASSHHWPIDTVTQHLADSRQQDDQEGPCPASYIGDTDRWHGVSSTDATPTHASC